MPQPSSVTITNAHTLADGVREFTVDIDQQTIAIPTLNDFGGVAVVGPRTYRMSVVCNEAVFKMLFNIVMRNSSDAPDLATLARYVEVPE